MTPKLLADAAEIPESTVKNIVYGRVDNIRCGTLIKLADALGCSVDELLGRASMRTTESNLLHSFQMLPRSSQVFVQAVINFEASIACTPEEYGAFKKEIIVFCPVGNTEDNMLYNSCHFIKVDAGPYIKKYGAQLIHCGIMLENNSLAPVYHYGDILLICNRPPRSGDVAVFIHRTTGKLYLRKYFPGPVTRLEPVNRYGDVISIDNAHPSSFTDWTIFGYVVTKMRTKPEVPAAIEHTMTLEP